MKFAEGACGPVPEGGRIRTGAMAVGAKAERRRLGGLPRKTRRSEDDSRTSLCFYFSDEQIADCLATMRAKQCVKRHPSASLDRYFKGVYRHSRVTERLDPNNPGAYMPPRRLWSRIKLSQRRVVDKSAYNKMAIMRHIRWVITHEKLSDFEWGRRFTEFTNNIRARVERGDFGFQTPISFAVEKPGKDTRFVTSFLCLEDKVILRQVAKYLRRNFDGNLSPSCYSFRQNSCLDHSSAFKALIDYRQEHKGRPLYVAECDIRKFFDVIDHDVARIAFERMAKKSGVEPLASKAVRAYLDVYTSTETLLEGAKSHSFEKCRGYVEKIKEALAATGKRCGMNHALQVGVPQGGAISMLIANWVLDIADKRVESRADKELFYARFCDDILIVHPDKRKCQAARDRYLRALKRLRLPYHLVRNGIPYGEEFYAAKSKGPHVWRELRTPHERGAAPWVSFVGNQLKYSGEVRVRQESVSRHVASMKEARGKMLGLLYESEREDGGIQLRMGTRACPVSKERVIEAMVRTLVGKGVGYLRSGPFAAGDMCWLSAFPDIWGREAELQLRRLDSIRARVLYPLQKQMGSRHYLGRPASYYGFLARVARPAVGSDRKLRVARIGYSGL